MGETRGNEPRATRTPKWVQLHIKKRSSNLHRLARIKIAKRKSENHRLHRWRSNIVN